MMFRKQSNPWMRTKALYIIPVAAMALSVFATPELNNRVDAIAEETPAMAVPSAAAPSTILEGRVLVEFYVEKDGSITNVKSILFKGKSGQYAGNNQPSNTEEYAQAYNDTKSLETEAERVVSSMPKWNPGMNNGQPIRTKFVIPVTFSL